MLSNDCLWVTRPSPAGDLLCNGIRHAGGKAIHFPAIEIHPVKTDLSALDAQDYLIFVSPQAVYHSVDLPSHTKIIAMGQGTKNALEKSNIPVFAYPASHSSTEELLLLPCLQNIRGKKIGLVKGQGGRETLEIELKARGAIVTPLIVYERRLPKKETVPSIERNSIILCTSCDILRNLMILMKNQEDVIKELPLIVISDRIKALASALGFKKIVLASDANIKTIMEIMDKIYARKITYQS